MSELARAGKYMGNHYNHWSINILTYEKVLIILQRETLYGVW